MVINFRKIIHPEPYSIVLDLLINAIQNNSKYFELNAYREIIIVFISQRLRLYKYFRDVKAQIPYTIDLCRCRRNRDGIWPGIIDTCIITYLVIRGRNTNSCERMKQESEIKESESI